MVPGPRQVILEEAQQSSISLPDLTSKLTHGPLQLRLLGMGFRGDGRSKRGKSQRSSTGHTPPS